MMRAQSRVIAALLLIMIILIGGIIYSKRNQIRCWNFVRVSGNAYSQILKQGGGDNPVFGGVTVDDLRSQYHDFCYKQLRLTS